MLHKTSIFPLFWQYWRPLLCLCISVSVFTCPFACLCPWPYLYVFVKRLWGVFPKHLLYFDLSCQFVYIFLFLLGTSFLCQFSWPLSLSLALFRSLYRDYEVCFFMHPPYSPGHPYDIDPKHLSSLSLSLFLSVVVAVWVFLSVHFPVAATRVVCVQRLWGVLFHTPSPLSGARVWYWPQTPFRAFSVELARILV